MEIVLLSREKKEMIEMMKEGQIGQEFLMKLFTINVEKAQATVSKDREVILEVVKQVGVVKVNDISLGQIKAMLVVEAKQLLAELDPESIEFGNVLFCLGNVHKALGEFDLALPRCGDRLLVLGFELTWMDRYASIK